MEDKYFTVPEVAEMFRCTADTVRKKFREGTWPASKSGKNYLASSDDIEQIKKIIRPEPKTKVRKNKGRERI